MVTHTDGGITSTVKIKDMPEIAKKLSLKWIKQNSNKTAGMCSSLITPDPDLGNI